ncbi:MurR/RpiR family transcriptional regulator [Psychrobacillus sp. NEAU-3TGS]|uniref:MurR/RpiR family transcriptional regulator n=1 Tax=Psychrobacillus sp. NEAU-3TGS TaxID=2995412 RepID=UPI0024965508|nr:MurR/RpiR family transcriptional regulator [Psychrobacillus sp. NEAU-3TGS]MDI2585646.1 MurR/RpiR family transcriptional regulator [Psychrobacillus sp. NEAU-3TGS]
MYEYETRIKDNFNALSNSLKKVAELLKEHPFVFASNSAEKIGKIIGVSETSVIRLAYSLGYKSFLELQKEVRASVFEMKSTILDYDSNAEPLRQESSVFEQVMLRDQVNIRRTTQSLNESNFNEAVNKISNANQVVVVGNGASFGLAHWFCFTLNTIRGNSKLINLNMDDYFSLQQLDEECVLIAFSFSRYMVQTLHVAEELKRKKVFVIGITDSEISPIAEHANLLFSTKLTYMSTLDSAPVVTSLLNALLAGIILKDADKYKKQKATYEKTYSKLFFN